MHGIKHHRQRNEHQAGAVVNLGRIAAVEGDYRRNNHQARDEREQGIEYFDLRDRMLQQVFLLHIRAVGNHDTHGQRHRVKQLAESAEHSRGRELRKVGQQIVFQAGHCAVDRQRVDCDDHAQHGKHRHHDAAGLFNALFHTEDNDQRGQQHINQKPRGRAAEVQHGSRDGACVKADEIVEKSAVVGRGQTVAGKEGGQIFHHPAADDAVIRRDDDRHKRRDPAEEAEPAVERLICPDAGQTGFAADGDLGNHQRKAEGDGQNDIHQQENAAAVLCGQIGESPEVAKTYRRTGRCQHKADAAGKAAS